MATSASALEEDTGRGPGTVRAVVADRVASIVFDHQQRRNALTREMLSALAKFVGEFDRDARIGAIVIQGAGDRAFSSGVDTAGLAERSEMQASDRLYMAARRAIRGCDTPVLAKIQGQCRGGGLAIALEADFRVCTDGSQFSIGAARIGLPFQDPAPLLRAVGSSWASEMLFTGRTLSSAEAVAARLVNYAVPSSEIDSAVMTVAHAIASNAPLSIRAMKHSVRALGDGSYEEKRAFIDGLIEACATSADLAEGLSASMERRAPNFEGR